MHAGGDLGLSDHLRQIKAVHGGVGKSAARAIAVCVESAAAHPLDPAGPFVSMTRILAGDRPTLGRPYSRPPSLRGDRTTQSRTMRTTALTTGSRRPPAVLCQCNQIGTVSLHACRQRPLYSRLSQLHMLRPTTRGLAGHLVPVAVVADKIAATAMDLDDEFVEEHRGPVVRR